jgi:predicted nuclease with TOPRIM domain
VEATQNAMAVIPRADSQQDDGEHLYAEATRAWHRHAAEKDALRKEVEELRLGRKCDKVEIEALNIRINSLNSEVHALQAERDQLVDERAHLEAMLATVKAALQGIEARPWKHRKVTAREREEAVTRQAFVRREPLVDPSQVAKQAVKQAVEGAA